MDNIELTNRRTRESSMDSLNTYKADDDVTTGSKHSKKSIIPTKKTLGQRLYAKVPPFQLTRTIIKASIGILIGLLFVFEKNCSKAVGPAGILVPIATLMYFPIRPLGVQIEACFQGIFSALVGAAWSFLAMYLANLARDPSIPTPVQPYSSAVLAVFMFIGVFGITYVRVKFPQANFATIFASMIVSFCLTQAAITPGFQPTVVYTFLKPIAFATAIGLVVDVLLWPDDSITKYMGVLNKSLKEYNGFFQEHSDAFLSSATETPSATTTLPSLHARLQNSILTLIDSKREVQREILFNRICHDDIKQLTKIVKMMRGPLHGIGLSLITKTDRLAHIKQPYFSSTVANEGEEEKEETEEVSRLRKDFLSNLDAFRKNGQEFSDTCVTILDECNARLMKFSGKPRSLTSTILWPFPRIFLSDYKKNYQQTETEADLLSVRFKQAIDKYEQANQTSPLRLIDLNSKVFKDRFNGLLQILYLFEYNLGEHANYLLSLIACLETMEAKRTKRRLWIPHLTLRKYFRSTDVNPSMGGPVGSVPGSNGAAGGGGGGGGGEANHEMSTDLNLTQTMSRHDMLNNYVEDVELAGSRNQKGTLFSRDPDINPPETAFERFFYKVHIYSQWMSSIDAMFALKTSAGFVLLSLPAFLPQSYAWFFAQHGQWATVTLMMWMFPMAGMFAFTIILRILGTVLGGVAGIIIWEITRGNPYGLVILTFFVMWPLYYVFFTNQVLNIVAIMTQVTLMLVICYEYQFIANGVAVHDSVEMIAGKRILLVLIGVAASAILSMIPKPVTGRVELRKRLSQTIADMSKLYAILIGDLVTIYENNRDPTPGQTKAFKKLALGIRRQIADEQMFLKLSKLEPSMRGKFPVEVYTRLVEKVDNMSDLLLGMAYASKSIDRSWQRNIVHVLRQHRTEYLASILAIMKLLSATLSSKMALPPYMLSPKELRERLAQRLSQVIVESPDHLDMNTFPGYCAYAVNSFKFSEELGEVLECVEQLVGVEDPEQWLLIHA